MLKMNQFEKITNFATIKQITYYCQDGYNLDEATFGIPQSIADGALSRLPVSMQDVVLEFYKNLAMSKLENLLNECRYYRGEAEKPQDLNPQFSLFWIAEWSAVEALMRGDENEILADYKEIGEPGKYTNVSPIILDLLFWLYCKGVDKNPADLIEPFEKKFLPRYMASTVM
jgi:hypothetical protein